MAKPILLFGYGNLSRGDDALGPLLLEFVESHVDLTNIDLLTDFQLQIEHALDLENRQLVLFIDASVACNSAFDFSELKPAKDNTYTTHAMSPSAVMEVYQSVKKQLPPPCFLLGIKGERFELGEGLGINAEKHLAQAALFVQQLLGNPDLQTWRKLANNSSAIDQDQTRPAQDCHA
jgi:hydrogenase maturation protease